MLLGGMKNLRIIPIFKKKTRKQEQAEHRCFCFLREQIKEYRKAIYTFTAINSIIEAVMSGSTPLRLPEK